MPLSPCLLAPLRGLWSFHFGNRGGPLSPLLRRRAPPPLLIPPDNPALQSLYPQVFIDYTMDHDQIAKACSDNFLDRWRIAAIFQVPTYSLI